MNYYLREARAMTLNWAKKPAIRLTGKPGASCVLLTFCLLLTACTNSPYTFTFNDTVVYSPIQLEPHAGALSDANLQGCLNQTMRDNDIDDLREVSSLLCPNSNVSSLLGIDALSGLQQLDVSGNRINELNPLQPLRNLRRLNVANNNIRNTSTLNSMSMLGFVDVSGNPDLSCRQLTRLEERLGSSLIKPQACL